MRKKEFKKIEHMFHVGDIAIVKENPLKTKKFYGCNSSMFSLIGQKVKIGLVNWDYDFNRPCILANGWKWHPDDLYVIEPAIKKPLIVGGQEGVFKFDIKNLQGD
jgi:hypothetical protein